MAFLVQFSRQRFKAFFHLQFGAFNAKKSGNTDTSTACLDQEGGIILVRAMLWKIPSRSPRTVIYYYT